MGIDSEIKEFVNRVRRRSLPVCENCGGQGYGDGGTTACYVCLGAGVTTPEMLTALRERAAYRAVLERIAKNETTVFDEAEGRDVLVSMDDEELSGIAYTALAPTPSLALPASAIEGGTEP